MGAHGVSGVEIALRPTLADGREAHHHGQGQEGDERDVHEHDRE